MLRPTTPLRKIKSRYSCAQRRDGPTMEIDVLWKSSRIETARVCAMQAGVGALLKASTKIWRMSL